jgi:F-type H+-transporting ATPase subunit epsilon
MATLKLSILSPERRLLQDTPVEEVTLSGSEGEIQILPGHAAMVGTLDAGEFHYRVAGGQKTGGVISSGFFEVRGEHVSVLAETHEVLGEPGKSGGASTQH